MIINMYEIVGSATISAVEIRRHVILLSLNATILGAFDGGVCNSEKLRRCAIDTHQQRHKGSIPAFSSRFR